MKAARGYSALPVLMGELAGLLEDPMVGMGEVAALMKRDAALAARLIRIANSSALAQAEPVSSVEDACQVLGMRELYRVTGVMAADEIGLDDLPLYGATAREVRLNSVLVALLMEEMARGRDVDGPAAYVVGLLRPIGYLLFNHLGGRSGVVPFVPEGQTLCFWEVSVFGRSSVEATREVLEGWKFPASLSKAILLHRDAVGCGHRLAALAHLACALADRLGYGLPCEKGVWSEGAEVYREASIDPLDVRRLLPVVFADFDRLVLKDCRTYASR